MNTYPAVVLVLMISIYLTSHLEKKPTSLSHTYKEQSRVFEHVRLSFYALPISETRAVLIHTHICNVQIYKFNDVNYIALYFEVSPNYYGYHLL